MYTFSVQLRNLAGDCQITHLVDRLSLEEAIYFGECQVKEALSCKGHKVGEPIFLNVVEEGNEVNPSFSFSRFGQEEDRAPLTPYVITYLPEEGPQLWWTKCSAWVEDSSLAERFVYFSECKEELLKYGLFDYNGIAVKFAQ